MNTFKVYWKNGTTELLMGNTISEAFNAAGYGDLTYLDALEKWSLVTMAHADEVINGVFSCALCKGPMVINKLADLRYVAMCQDCQQDNATSEYTSPESARWSWNQLQLGLQAEMNQAHD